MVAYASVEDVRVILPEAEEDIPPEAEDRLVRYLEEVTDLVIGFLGREYDDEPDPELDDGVPGDVPGAVRRVVARVALRGFIDAPDNPGAQAETHLMGPFSWNINWSKEAQARDFFLTDADRLRLRRYQLSSSRAAYHAPMVGFSGHDGPWWS